MKYGVCLEMFFTDMPFLGRIESVAEAGYRFAEMWFIDGTFDGKGINNNDPKNPARVRAAAEKAGVTITNAVIGSPDGSLGGGLTDPARRAEWLKRTDATLAFCREAGIGAAIVCTGNVIPRRAHAEMRHSVLDGLKATVERAEAAGIDLFIEPLNDKIDHPNYFLTHSKEGADLCRAVGSARLKLLFDCYHMQITEGDLSGGLRAARDVLGHVHSAGHPGRHELWEGETNYPYLIGLIQEMGYQQVFALEYMPKLPSAESLRKTLEHLSQ